MQLARRRAQPRRHQHGGDLLPGDAFLACRQKIGAQRGQARPAPQRQRQVHIPELPRALDADALQPHRHRHIPAAVVEQLRLLWLPDHMPRQHPRRDPALLVELAKVRHRLLDHPLADTHAAHQAPGAVRLAVLLANRMAQVHAPAQSSSSEEENTLGRHYTPKSPPRTTQPFDPTNATAREIVKTTLQLRKLG